MTTEQIKAINNTMSMLTGIIEGAHGCINYEIFEAYINRHLQALKDSKVDNTIIEHVTHLCIPYISYAKHITAIYKKQIEREAELRKLEEKCK